MTACDPQVKPFLKWAGGKRFLLPEILTRWPRARDDGPGTYVEPFLGGGAVLLAAQPCRALVNDINADLITCYEVVRDAVDDLIACLHEHPNDAEHYYAVRAWDRAADYPARSPVERAARLIYLNKTCYNGLFRVNAAGHFNVPFGRYLNPTIADAAGLRAVSAYLRSAEIRFTCGDFAAALATAGAGDFAYIDPPYDFEPDAAAFTSYARTGFAVAEQARLKAVVDDLDRRGCRFLLSNAATPRALDLYAAYHTDIVGVPRPINSDVARRGKVREILVRNYGDE